MEKVLTLKEISDLFEKYGDLNIEVETPFGFKKINNAGITKKDSDIWKLELEDGKFIEGAKEHRVKRNNGEFINLTGIKFGDSIQTVDGCIIAKSLIELDFKEDLYDIEVDEVSQYYSNGIVSHNSSFSVDAIEYLFFGKTSKTDTQDEIFNSYTNKDTVTIRGCTEIEGSEYIIERILTRKKKREGGYNVKGDVVYYEILPDGEERQLEGDHSIETSKLIEDTIGSFEDFRLTIMATAKNLEDLIDTKPTERGKLLTRFIGLEPIEQKEEVVRKMYNEFAKKMVSNTYNISQLESDNETFIQNLVNMNELKVGLDERLITLKEEINNLNIEKDEVAAKKFNIDDAISKLNPQEIEKNVAELTAKGIKSKESLDKINDRLKELGEIEFDEDDYRLKVKEKNNLIIDINTNGNELKRNNKFIEDLKSSEICPMCKRPLDGIDHGDEIKKTNEAIKSLTKLIDDDKKKLEVLTKTIDDLDIQKKSVTEKQTLEIDVDRLEVEMEGLRNKIRDKKGLLKQHSANNAAIETNKQLDSEINNLNTKLKILDVKKDNLITDIQKTSLDITSTEGKITTNNELIVKIQREDIIEKIYKIYIEMVGKRGISKLVLRTVIPIINAEIERLLDDICDFNVELQITDKNDVRFVLIKDDIEKNLKTGSGLERTISAIALRAVLGRISYLPKPNFLEFDEVWGTIADDNLDNLRNLFEKLMDWYDVIFIITHNNVVRDWASKIITFKKVNNISTIDSI